MMRKGPGLRSLRGRCSKLIKLLGELDKEVSNPKEMPKSAGDDK